MYPTPSAAKAAELYGAAGAHPVALLVEAHDGMIAKLGEAKTAIAEGRIEDRFQLTTKIGKVVDVLQMTLDHEQGGEIAGNLDRLYTYFGRRLHDVNLKNDASVCDELIARLGELRDGWRAVLRQPSPVQPVLETASISA